MRRRDAPEGKLSLLFTSTWFDASPIFPSVFPRLIEKDNRKAREDARKEYNDTVRVRDLSHKAQILILVDGISLSSSSYASEIPVINHICILRVKAIALLRFP